MARERALLHDKNSLKTKKKEEIRRVHEAQEFARIMMKQQTEFGEKMEKIKREREDRAITKRDEEHKIDSAR